MPAASPPDQAATLEARIGLERSRIFFGLTRGNMLSMVAGVATVATVLYAGGTAPIWIGLWGLLFLGACGAVLGFEHHVQRQGVHLHNHTRLLRTRILMGSGVALFYGLSGWMLPNRPTIEQDTLLFIILSTVVTVSSLGFTAMPRQYLWISAATLGPLSGHFVHRYATFGESDYLLLLGISVGWLGFVLSKSLAVSRTTLEAIRLNQELQDEIEEHRRTREAMRVMAMHDALTGLGNRRYFDQMLKRSIANARRGAHSFGLVALDLNEFKPVNDRLGHAAGDQLLQSVALRLKESTREGDFCARLGGDEFALLLDGPVDQAVMAQATAQLRQRFEAVHYLDCAQAAVRATASIGWAVYPDDGKEFAHLMGVADARMYRDKQSRKAGDAQSPDDSDRSTARTGDASASTSRSGNAISS
jgi:diguanylate cyclase (GGDEF)-like protein